MWPQEGRFVRNCFSRGWICRLRFGEGRAWLTLEAQGAQREGWSCGITAKKVRLKTVVMRVGRKTLKESERWCEVSGSMYGVSCSRGPRQNLPSGNKKSTLLLAPCFCPVDPQLFSLLIQ